MNSNNEKGRQLEQAVEAIENIAQRIGIPPGSLVTVLPRKIIFTNGVKHEIDLWVEVDGRLSLIIECKNWAKTVGKNEVIVFAEKLRVTKAEKGIVIGRRFSKYAAAQAALCRGMELKVADENVGSLRFFPAFHVVEQLIYSDQSRVEIKFLGATPQTLDGTYMLNGEAVSLEELAKKLVQKVIDLRMASEDTTSRIGDEYQIKITKWLKFNEGNLTYGGYRVLSVRVTTVFKVKVSQPETKWKFQVEDRGIAIHQLFKSQSNGSLEIGVTFASAPAQEAK